MTLGYIPQLFCFFGAGFRMRRKGGVDGISAKRVLQAVRRSLRGTERVTAPPDV